MARRRLSPDGLPVDDVVQSLFLSILSRPADPEALAFYTRALARGARVESVVRSLESSPEAGISAWRDPPARSLGPAVWAARRARPEERQIYVVDPPGSAGDRLVDALRTVSAGRVCLTGLRMDQAVWVPDLLLRHASLVSGPLGAVPGPWLSPDAVTAAVVRHPVDRMVAHYRSLTTDPLTREAMRGVSFTTFATGPEWHPLVSDVQARHLTRRLGDPVGWEASRAPAGRGGPAAVYRELPLQAVVDLSPPDRPAPELARAAVEVLNSVDVAGTPENLDAVLDRLAGEWGVTAPGPVPPPPAPDRAPHEVDVRVADDILAANPADLALFERARSLSP